MIRKIDDYYMDRLFQPAADWINSTWHVSCFRVATVTLLLSTSSLFATMAVMLWMMTQLVFYGPKMDTIFVGVFFMLIGIVIFLLFICVLLVPILLRHFQRMEGNTGANPFRHASLNIRVNFVWIMLLTILLAKHLLVIPIMFSILAAWATFCFASCHNWPPRKKIRIGKLVELR